jgi:outer membrane protein OmpA-like peptidoglycan-associated protein
LLHVILQDDSPNFLRKVFPGRFSRVIDVAVEIPCEEVTRVIYRRVNEIVKRKVLEVVKEGATKQNIELDEVFAELLRGEMEQYIDRLGTPQAESPCSKTFRLLKWLRGDDVPGFEFGEYELNEELKGLLQPVTDALTETRAASERYDLEVKVVGYTDDIPVKTKGIKLLRENMGSDDWSHVVDFPEIKYGGCSGDHQDGHRPVYTALFGGRGRQIRGRIYNNCELGAVRAYVAANYLVMRLGRESVSYSYATGGIFSNSHKKDNDDDRNKRKVKITFTVNAARIER